MELKVEKSSPDEETTKLKDENIGRVIVPTNCDYFIIQFANHKKKGERRERRPFSVRFPGFQFESSEYSSAEAFREAVMDNVIQIPDAGYQCNFCGKMFEKKNHSMDHVELHFARKKTHYYVCKKCGKYVKTETGLRQHIANKQSKACLSLNLNKYT